MRILLISGHGGNPYDPGACSSYGTEADETRRVVAELKNQFGNYNVTVDVYPTNRNCYDDVKNGCVQVNFKNYDYIYEVHFNSASASATGTEIWVVPEEGGTGVEQGIVNKLSALGLSNRGVKAEYFAVINYAKNRCGVSAALIETCFISNQNDMNIYNNNFTNMCKAMVDGIAEGFNLTKVSKAVEIDEMSWDGVAKVDYKVTAYAHSTDVNVLYKYFYEIDGQWTTLTDWQELNRASFKPKKAGRYKIVCHVKYKSNKTDKEDAYNYFNLDVEDKPATYTMEVDGEYYGKNDMETILKAVDKEMANGKSIVLNKSN